jgi:hypothetical protein
MFEREFGSGEETYRDTPIFLRGKSARRYAVETGCDKHLSNLSWARRNSMQAIIAHGFSPLISAPRAEYDAMASDNLDHSKLLIVYACDYTAKCKRKLRAPPAFGRAGR